MAAMRTVLFSVIFRGSRTYCVGTVRLFGCPMVNKSSAQWIRNQSSFNKSVHERIRKFRQSANERTVIYVSAIAIGILGLSYAAVPLYRLYCQVSICVVSGEHLCCVRLAVPDGVTFTCSERD